MRNHIYLEVSDSKVKKIRAKQSKRNLLVPSLEEANISSFDRQGLSEAIAAVTETENGKTKINLLLSTSHLLIKTIEIPKLKDKDIQSLIEKNLTQYFTVGSEMHISSYRILNSFDKEGKEFVEILLFAYPKEEMDMIKEVCAENDLVVVSAEPYSNMVFEEYRNQPCPIAVVHVEEGKVNCVILKGNHLFLHAWFDPHENDDFSFAETTSDETILSNLEGYFNFYSSKNYGEKIKQIFLFSKETSEDLPILIEYKTEIPVDYNVLPFPIQFKNKEEDFNPHEFFSLFLFAKNLNKKNSMNLLTHSVYQEKKQSNLLIVSAFLLVAGIMGYSIFTPFYEKHQLEESIASYEDELFQHKEVAEELTTLKQLTQDRVAKEKALTELNESQYNFPRLLAVFYSLLPEGVYIEQFVVKESGVISVQFSVSNTLQSTKLTDGLNASEYFNPVYIESARLDDKKEIIQLDFELKEEVEKQFMLGGEHVE